MKKILIVGAGYAGIEAALTLNKKKKKEELEITLIDKNNYHTLLTELHEVAGNRVSEEAVRIPLDRIFKYTSVKIINDEIKQFDLSNNRLVSERKEYSYDYLVLALGSTPNFFGIPGMQEHAFTLWSYDDALKVRGHIKKCFALAAQETDAEERRRLLTFAVGGAGFTGVEMIGELANWVKDLAKLNRIKREEVRLVLIDMMPCILCNLSKKSAQKAHKYLEKKLGVEVFLDTAVKGLDAEKISCEHRSIPTGTLIWTAGIRASEDVDNMDLEKLGLGCRLQVDEFCRTKYENVYSVGDVAALLDENRRPAPAMVETAIQTARGAAQNILSDIRKEKQQQIKTKMHGTMVSVGYYYTVADIMGRVLPFWLATIMKYAVNMHYLWEITGFWGVGKYLYHELLERKQHKHLLEKHWSTRLQAWWLTPLRMYLGWVWFYEGVKKIGEGWLSNPKLATFLGSASGTTDATSSATAEVSSAAEGAANALQELLKLDLGIMQVYLEKANEMIFRIDFGLVNWFLEKFALATDGSQIFFQTAIVLAEIAVGLALISGTFTFLTSAGALFLTANFVMTTGVYEKTWWMPFAAIACMGGAGRAFGIDYYLIPYLNNVWEYLWKNHELRLFFRRSLDRDE